VTLAVPAGIQAAVAATEPSYLTVALAEDDQGRISRQATSEIEKRSRDATAIAIGPGWGRSPDLVELANFLYSTVQHALVVDADALNALANPIGGFPKAPVGAPRILTPHPGEFARILGSDTASVQRDRETFAVDFARKHGAIVVLKGHRTVISDGEKVAINATGNSGMATGGSGDVLTGLVASLLAQGMAPFSAAQLAVYLHGLAGDLAAGDLSQPGLIASDLPRYLGKAWKQAGAK
jgi:NAD(P)H-hydrate epimerase